MRRRLIVMTITMVISLLPFSHSQASECVGAGASGQGFEVCVSGGVPVPQIVDDCSGECTSIVLSGEGGSVSIDCIGDIECNIPEVHVPGRNVCVASFGVQTANTDCLVWAHG